MATPAQREATIEDLYNIDLPEGYNAELVDGEIVLMSPTGGIAHRASLRLADSLLDHEDRTHTGYAYGDGIAFVISTKPRKRSFGPDAAWHLLPPTDTKFINGPPLFAAEIRSESDYGPAADRRIARKQADYFAAGTLVVWDVDILGTDVVKVYRASDPTTPTIYRRGEIAEAEPAVPGWTMPVDYMFL
jgi:Uma2 family endonuclease